MRSRDECGTQIFRSDNLDISNKLEKSALYGTKRKINCQPESCSVNAVLGLCPGAELDLFDGHDPILSVPIPSLVHRRKLSLAQKVDLFVAT